MNSREFHNLITIGNVVEVNENGVSARVQIGDIKTPFLKLPAIYSENFKAWTPTKSDAQAVLASPSGNLDAAVIIGLLWPKAGGPYTTDRDVDGVKFSDGTRIEYNSKEKILRVTSVGNITIEAAGDVTVQAAANMTLKAAQKLTIEAPQIDIKGPVKQTGGDMTSAGVSAQNHKHVETGTITKVPT